MAQETSREHARESRASLGDCGADAFQRASELPEASAGNFFPPAVRPRELSCLEFGARTRQSASSKGGPACFWAWLRPREVVLF